MQKLSTVVNGLMDVGVANVSKDVNILSDTLKHHINT